MIETRSNKMEGEVDYSSVEVCKKKDSRKSYLAVFVIQCMYAGMILLQKAVFNSGMNCFVFVFYRQAVAAAFLAPLALCFNWKHAPRLSFATFWKIFVVSLLGTTISLDLYGVALVYTTASLASATANCLPAITFFLAVLLRMETWKMKTVPGVAKLLGSITCIGGTLVLALYKGLTIRHLGMIGHHFQQQDQGSHHLHGNVWVKGVFLMITSNTLFALLMVLQGPILKSYPSKLLFNTLSCSLSAVQSFVVAIAIERDPAEWKLGWDLRLVSVTYCGVVVTGVSYYLQSYVIEKKGAVFLTTWTPMSFLITTFFSSLFLGEDITLGSILGGVLLVGGLYSVLWGKTREERQSILPQTDVVKKTVEKTTVLVSQIKSDQP